MKKLKTIVDRIKEKNIKQRPKWYFTTLNTLIWICYIICILIGAASFSVILFSIHQTDFNLISHMSHSRLEMFLGILPFFWIIILLIFLFASIIIFHKSKSGYKFNWFRLLTFSAAVSVLLGVLFFIGGGGLQLEYIFSEKVSFYQSIHENNKKIWMNPEEGYLSGTIEKISGDIIHLIDFNNKKWDVDYSNASISGSVILKRGERVKLIGKITQQNNFYVSEIRIWNGKRQYRFRNKNNKKK